MVGGAPAPTRIAAPPAKTQTTTDKKGEFTMPKLDGNVAVITGATSGMALATARAKTKMRDKVVDGMT